MLSSVRDIDINAPSKHWYLLLKVVLITMIIMIIKVIVMTVMIMIIIMIMIFMMMIKIVMNIMMIISMLMIIMMSIRIMIIDHDHEGYHEDDVHDRDEDGGDALCKIWIDIDAPRTHTDA